MNVWPYEFEGSWYWVAETPDGIRTRAFLGGPPGTTEAAAIAIAAARVIDAEFAAKGDQGIQDMGALRALEVRLPGGIHIPRGRESARPNGRQQPPELVTRPPRIFRISRSGDPLMLVTERQGRWLRAICHAATLEDAIAEAAALLAEQEVDFVEFKLSDDWKSTSDTGNSVWGR